MKMKRIYSFLNSDRCHVSHASPQSLSKDNLLRPTMSFQGLIVYILYNVFQKILVNPEEILIVYVCTVNKKYIFITKQGWAKYFEITKQVLKSKMCEIILKSNNSAQLYFDMEGFIFIQFVAAFIPNHTRQINKQEETGFQK